MFVDPPYTAGHGKRAGARLYDHADINHQELFALMSAVNGAFLMTYDGASDIRELAAQYGFETQTIAMKNTHHAEMTELLIGRDLLWLKEGDR
ncbi:D12 class N6 adenine-specific DNA methyltransferase [Candidatus Moduliflexus flocculans]|uniref:D12 class N6 adenine-specific DNA methyltransferase n=1 Tax=Candidatus Moduliflexus flocculans TaxID=1499966 RepID=A0A0S6W3X9_9BACT|nr:D12 class N6 adenine-specific DNA methyltransferase [Candidatus Moduliflexus flocculans]